MRRVSQRYYKEHKETLSVMSVFILIVVMVSQVSTYVVKEYLKVNTYQLRLLTCAFYCTSLLRNAAKKKPKVHYFSDTSPINGQNVSFHPRLLADFNKLLLSDRMWKDLDVF